MSAFHNVFNRKVILESSLDLSSLCDLSVLYASVVSVCQIRVTTETQSPQRTHREVFNPEYLNPDPLAGAEIFSA